MYKNKRIRVMSQIFFFVLVGLIGFNHYLSETGQNIGFIGSSSIHAICPFGGVEAMVALLQFGTWIPKIHSSAMVLFGIILVLSILFGPIVCSYMCPLGSIQEWIGNLGKKIFKKRYNHFIPTKLDKALRYLRYAVLIFTVYLTTNSLKLVFLEVDPYYALFNFWSAEATIGGIIVLIIVLLSSLFVERAWCKYACPFGAAVGLTNKISVFKIRRNTNTCISCNKCSVACPMNIDVVSKETITDDQCIRCGQCTSERVCPVNETVELKMAMYTSGFPTSDKEELI